MYVHHVIDALNGKKNAPRLALPDVEMSDKENFIEWIEMMGRLIPMAHPFVFENVPIAQDGEGGIDLPGLTPEERDMFNEGLFPLPFESCWFEVPGGQESEAFCYYLQETSDGYIATPFRFIKPYNVILITGTAWKVRRRPDEDAPDIIINDLFGGAALMSQEFKRVVGADIGDHRSAAGEVGMLGYLLMMLHSRSTESRTEPAPHKLNKARIKKGNAPIPEHRIVSIVPYRIAKDIRREYGDSGFLRASPRLHWRRSHIRTMENGKRIPIARMLIGYKADDGREMVTQEYHVKL